MGDAYKIMFIVGILYTFVSLIISGISGALHLGSHVGHMHTHIGGHGDISGFSGDHSGDFGSHHADTMHGSAAAHTFISWISIVINPMVAVSFLTVFGGLGIIGTDHFGLAAVVVFLISLVSGITVSSLLYKFIVVPLYRSENSTDVSRQSLVNKTAEVISPILENGFGEIKYTVNSIRYTAPAKHIGGKAVAQGETVIIYKIEDNIFYVI